MDAVILFSEHRKHVARLKYLDAALGEDRLSEYTGQPRAVLEQQRRDQLRHLQLYDAVMASLTAKERWLVQRLYDDELSLHALTEESKSPFYQQANSTVWRYKERMLGKANAFLHSLEEPPF